MVVILENTEIDGKDDTRIITNLHRHQVASVRVKHHQVSSDIERRRGVRQGYILSPLLFNLYYEKIFK